MNIIVKDVKEGMILLLGKYEYLVDDVQVTRDGQIKISHSNETGTEFFDTKDIVKIKLNSIYR